LADGGSRDDTLKIADAAGCEFVAAGPDEGTRLAAAARAARGDRLLFLVPGAILDEGWPREVGAFLARSAQAGECAATFRFAIDATGLTARLRETAAAWRLALLSTPRMDQGLLIKKQFYQTLGGHLPGPHSRRTFLNKLGRGRIAGLRTRIIV
jgi:hypothetical protein